jgi:hypothetical protein
MEQKLESNQLVAQYLTSWRLLDGGDIATTTVSGYPKSRLKWYAMIEEYSRRSLSVKTDKLPAISGIAAEIAKRRSNDRYLAGLWQSDIFRGLSWFPDPAKNCSGQSASSWPPKAVDPGIPSWSWAAYDGPIIYHGESWFSGVWEKAISGDDEEWIKKPPRIQLHNSRINHSSLDMFGRICGGEIMLSGWAIEISISEAQHAPNQSEKPFGRKFYSLAEHPTCPCSAMIYFDVDVDQLPKIEVMCLQLGTGKGARGTPSMADNGLVLMKTGEGQFGVYRRVGMFDVGSKDEAWTSRRCEKTVRIQ